MKGQVVNAGTEVVRHHALLTRLAGDALPASDAVPFGDVAVDAWYAEAVSRAAAAGRRRIHTAAAA